MADAYRQALKRGQRDCREAVAASRHPYLTALDALVTKADTAGEEHLGVMDVPLYLVGGTRTQGRQNAFSRTFMPILDEGSEFAVKWQHLYDIQVEEGFRDPIKAYEFMGRFYVQEGNKRTSVLKFLDAPTVSADVTRVYPREWDGWEKSLYGEFLEFWRACPIYGIEFTHKGSYKRLAALLGRSLDERWPDAAVSRLKSSFLYFKAAYEARGGGHLDITPADALLVYLGIYPHDDLLSTPSSILSERLGKVWRELALEAEGHAVDLVGEPAQEKAARHGVMDLVLRRARFTERRPLRAAFIYHGTLADSRWAVAHEQGRVQLEERFGSVVRTERFEGCSTDELVRSAVDQAVEHGADVVFTTSQVQMDETVKCSIHYPDVQFLNCSLNLPHDSVRSYYGRTYEVRFLLGALAASVAPNHRIGYRADYPIFGTIADINAFAIGAALVDPQARVVLRWATRLASDWRRELAEAGVSVAMGADMAHPGSGSRRYGLYRMDGDEVVNLALPLWDWGRYYELIVQSLLSGTWGDADGGRVRAVNYWYGISAGVIDVATPIALSYYSRKLVEALRRGVVSDALSPFDGELRSQTGLVKADATPRLTGEQIVSMDWLNDNVEGELPSADELNDFAREQVRVSGVVRP